MANLLTDKTDYTAGSWVTVPGATCKAVCKGALGPGERVLIEHSDDSGTNVQKALTIRPGEVKNFTIHDGAGEIRGKVLQVDGAVAHTLTNVTLDVTA